MQWLICEGGFLNYSEQAVRDQAELFDDALYAAVAAHLAGKPVELIWEAPYVKEFWGVCHNAGDRFVIKIKPDLTPEERFVVFLHECSHARQHSFAVSDNHAKAPASYRITDMSGYKASVQPIEDEAGALAERWERFVVDKDTISAKLRALLTWREQKRILIKR